MIGTKTHTRLALVAASALAGASASVVLTASPSAAAADVTHSGEQECFFEPGDVPGVDEFFPADCTIVVSDSGRTTVVARGWLPDGYSFDTAVRATIPCFEATGELVVTPSGRVTATCHF
ncbi:MULTISPECIES: hypothetical protein [unclassified Nocardioides]|jgi:hypothetical protein|uniref:hypothetical protein n=1 Tax=Nocardioides sp. URHA0032 TaxID=1380388 RepID=UPI00048F003D|nr:hypothetical protein [Nocardioides sp. URHA0032]